MKKILAVLIACSILLLSFGALAESPGGNPPGDPPSGEMGTAPNGTPPDGVALTINLTTRNI